MLFSIDFAEIEVLILAKTGMEIALRDAALSFLKKMQHSENGKH